jgi:hypothetical protein
MIQMHGEVELPKKLLKAADAIKFQNYKVNKIGRIQKHTDDGEDAQYILWQLGQLVKRDPKFFDMVYFSACSGAEPHVDMLDESRFENTTYVIPLILPIGDSIIKTRNVSIIAEVGKVYEFDHTIEHEMTVEDNKSGCVVLMVAVKRNVELFSGW